MGQQANHAARRRLNNRRRGPIWVAIVTLLAVGAALHPTTASPNPKRSSTAGIVPAFDEPLTQYRAFRRMHARSERLNQEGWLDAWTELDAHGFRYSIVSERGSDTVRNKVLKAVLERERELVAGGPERAALTEENYVFSEPEHPPDGAPYVRMKPKRKDVMLVDGRIILSPDGADVVRIEGRLAKNPSFWTSLVNIIRRFANVDGVRVPVSTETVAKIRFAGKSTLEVSYEYESINGRPVSSETRRALAFTGPAEGQ
jgi:hypothetical protein